MMASAKRGVARSTYFESPPPDDETDKRRHGGNLHALFNVTDEDISLLMFGGYD
jgi:hypothetical protein